ncbi:MAG: hypothetical protein WBF90_36885 [Rivularia sp. (in: cyanobacteria)]
MSSTDQDQIFYKRLYILLHQESLDFRFKVRSGGNGWSWATDGIGQRMELGNGWSWATDGVGQRMELGNGWNWATDGVGSWELGVMK